MESPKSVERPKSVESGQSSPSRSLEAIFINDESSGNDADADVSDRGFSSSSCSDSHDSDGNEISKSIQTLTIPIEESSGNDAGSDDSDGGPQAPKVQTRTKLIDFLGQIRKNWGENFAKESKKVFRTSNNGRLTMLKPEEGGESSRSHGTVTTKNETVVQVYFQNGTVVVFITAGEWEDKLGICVKDLSDHQRVVTVAEENSDELQKEKEGSAAMVDTFGKKDEEKYFGEKKHSISNSRSRNFFNSLTRSFYRNSDDDKVFFIGQTSKKTGTFLGGSKGVTFTTRNKSLIYFSILGKSPRGLDMYYLRFIRGNDDYEGIDFNLQIEGDDIRFDSRIFWKKLLGMISDMIMMMMMMMNN